MHIKRQTSKIRFGRIPPEMDSMWLVEVVTMNLEEITLLQAYVTAKENWYYQTLNILIQTEPQTQGESPERTEIREESLIVFVEVHKPRSFQCGELRHQV